MVKNLSKSGWVEARELKFCMNMLLTVLENFEILLKIMVAFLEHILKKWALLKSFCRPSVRLSVSYFSAAIAPRELQFST
jgi:hypothetical protein